MKKIKKKRKLIYSLTGLTLLLPLVTLAQWSPDDYTGTNLPAGTVYSIIRNFMLWLLAIFGAIGIIGFVISGIMYLTAAGDENQITKAKAAMKWSIVGVIVGLIGLVVLYAVDAALSPETTMFFF